MAKKKKRVKSAKRPPAHRPSPPQPSLVDTLTQYPDWTALGIFLFLTAIFFHDVIFGAKIFFTPDLQSPSALAAPLKKALWQDHIYPLWTPYIFMGMPSFASLIFTPFVYLPYILFTLLNQIVPLPPLLQHVIHYPVAGIGVYLYLREFKVDFLPALFGGLAFMFMPYLITMEAFGHGSQMMTAVYIPLAFWALERLFRRGGWLHFGIAALVLGLQFQRGHVQIVYYTWLAAGGYFLYHLVHHLMQKQPKPALKITGQFVAVAALAFGLAAVLYFSIYEYMPFSIRGSQAALAMGPPQKGVGFEYATQWSFSPAEMMTFLIPSFFGFGGRTYWGTMPFTDYPNYMGILVLLLAVFALIARRQRPTLFWGITAGVALLISYGKHFAVLYRLLYDFLPFFNRFRVPVMILILVQVSVAILAGFGLQRLIAFVRAVRQPARTERLVRNLWIAVAAVAGIAILLSVARGPFFQLMQGLYPDRYPPSTQLMLDRQRFDMLLRDWWLVSLWVAGGLTLLALALRNRVRDTVFAAMVLVFTLADLWAVDFELNKPEPRSRLDQYLAADHTARFLSADTTLFRVLPAGRLFSENKLAAQGIQSVGGYHAAKPRVIQDILDATQLDRSFVAKYYDEVQRNGRRQLAPKPIEQVDARLRKVHQNWLDFLNVKYVISLAPIPEAALKRLGSAQYLYHSQPIQVLIYENLQALPRAFTVGSYRLAADARQALVYLTSEQFDPRREVILYQKPEMEPAPDSSAAATVTHYELQRVEVKVACAQPQLLVLSDTYIPSQWLAEIDGRPTPILQANHGFRAVSVPPGQHTIVFRFHSRAFTLGLWISLASLIIIGACIGYGLRRRPAPPA